MHSRSVGNKGFHLKTVHEQLSPHAHAYLTLALILLPLVSGASIAAHALLTPAPPSTSTTIKDSVILSTSAHEQFLASRAAATAAASGSNAALDAAILASTASAAASATAAGAAVRARGVSAPAHLAALEPLLKQQQQQQQQSSSSVTNTTAINVPASTIVTLQPSIRSPSSAGSLPSTSASSFSPSTSSGADSNTPPGLSPNSNHQNAMQPVLSDGIRITSISPSSISPAASSLQIAAAAVAAQLQSASSQRETSERLHTIITSGTPEQRTIAVAHLATQGVEQLLASAMHDNGIVRTEALQALGRADDPRAMNVLLLLSLTDGYIPSRHKALSALQSLVTKHPNLATTAITMLGSNANTAKDPNVSWRAANALAHLGDGRGVDTINSVLERTEDEWLAWEGLQALRKVHNNNTLTVVYPFVTHPSSRVAEEAVVTMGCLTG